MRTVFLACLIIGFISSNGYCFQGDAKLISAIESDPEVIGVVSKIQKDRKWHCRPLVASDVHVSPGDLFTYIVRFQCGNPTGPTKFGDVIQFLIDVLFVKDVQDYTTHVQSWKIESRDHKAFSSLLVRSRCEIRSGDPQFPVLTRAPCCLLYGGTTDANESGHPPITMCHGGKYDGWYVAN